MPATPPHDRPRANGDTSLLPHRLAKANMKVEHYRTDAVGARTGAFDAHEMGKSFTPSQPVRTAQAQIREKVAARKGAGSGRHAFWRGTIRIKKAAPDWLARPSASLCRRGVFPSRPLRPGNGPFADLDYDALMFFRRLRIIPAKATSPLPNNAIEAGSGTGWRVIFSETRSPTLLSLRST